MILIYIQFMQKEENIVNGMVIYGWNYYGVIMENTLNLILKRVRTMKNITFMKELHLLVQVLKV